MRKRFLTAHEVAACPQSNLRCFSLDVPGTPAGRQALAEYRALGLGPRERNFTGLCPVQYS